MHRSGECGEILPRPALSSPGRESPLCPASACCVCSPAPGHLVSVIRSLSERERDHFIAACCCNCSILLLVSVFNLLMCLICTLDFALVMNIQAKRSIDRVQYSPWLQVSTRGLTMCAPHIRGDYHLYSVIRWCPGKGTKSTKCLSEGREKTFTVF